MFRLFFSKRIENEIIIKKILIKTFYVSNPVFNTQRFCSTTALSLGSTWHRQKMPQLKYTHTKKNFVHVLQSIQNQFRVKSLSYCSRFPLVDSNLIQSQITFSLQEASCYWFIFDSVNSESDDFLNVVDFLQSIQIRFRVKSLFHCSSLPSLCSESIQIQITFSLVKRLPAVDSDTESILSQITFSLQ